MRDVEIRLATRGAAQHDRNQDRVLAAGRVYDHAPDVVTARTPCPALIAVFDGLGGHLAGDVASDLAAHQLATTKPPTDEAGLSALLGDADARLHAAADEPGRDGMGTTVALIAIGEDADAALVANVGDSGVWQVTDDGLEPLSTSDRAFGSTITQCLGANAAGVDPHVRRIPVAVGDRFLIASDGLSDVVASTTIATTLRARGDAGVQQLVDAVASQGPPDDVTIVLVDVLAPSTARG